MKKLVAEMERCVYEDLAVTNSEANTEETAKAEGVPTRIPKLRAAGDDISMMCRFHVYVLCPSGSTEIASAEIPAHVQVLKNPQQKGRQAHRQVCSTCCYGGV